LTLPQVGTADKSNEITVSKTSTGLQSLIMTLTPYGHTGASKNCMHWVLDVAFREDDCRIRVGEAAQNFAALRRIALNLLKKEKTLKLGIAGKRLKADWNVTISPRYLAWQSDPSCNRPAKKARPYDCRTEHWYDVLLTRTAPWQ